mmetsp:Transcript_23361/g.65138  ORF Transcript_23361/g.65138 Transcript_23361/m.65138 type:complete len:257 (+) Transcript_23361:296-1066(+)
MLGSTESKQRDNRDVSILLRQLKHAPAFLYIQHLCRIFREHHLCHSSTENRVAAALFQDPCARRTSCGNATVVQQKVSKERNTQSRGSPTKMIGCGKAQAPGGFPNHATSDWNDAVRVHCQNEGAIWRSCGWQHHACFEEAVPKCEDLLPACRHPRPFSTWCHCQAQNCDARHGPIVPPRRYAEALKRHAKQGEGRCQRQHYESPRECRDGGPRKQARTYRGELRVLVVSQAILDDDLSSMSIHGTAQIAKWRAVS